MADQPDAAYTDEALKDKIRQLERQLGDLHGTDLVAVKRAYQSLCQHALALHTESQGMGQAIDSFEVWSAPEHVADELGVAGMVAAAMYVTFKLVRHSPFHKVRALQKGVWLAGAVFMGIRLTAGSLHRLGAMFINNARRKQQMQRDWKLVAERIEIMASLTQWAGSTGTAQLAAPHAVLAEPGPLSAPGGVHAESAPSTLRASEDAGSSAFNPYSPAGTSAARAPNSYAVASEPPRASGANPVNNRTIAAAILRLAADHHDAEAATLPRGRRPQ